MEFFLKFGNNEINLKNNAIVKYEYSSCKNFYNVIFNLKVVLNVTTLDENELDYIRKWVHEDQNFYRYLSFGNIFMKKIVKEIVFPDAYIFNIEEEFDFVEGIGLIILDISQKENRYQNVLIFPEISQKSETSKSQNFEIEDLLFEKSVNKLQTSNVKLFEEKLEKQEGMNDEYKHIIIEKFARGTEIAQNVFLKYVPDNAVDFVVLEEGEANEYCWDDKRIKIDIEHDLENFNGQGAAYFHEHGHLIDLLEVDVHENQKGIISKDFRFIEFLVDDFMNYVQTYADNNNISIYDAYSETAQIIYSDKHGPVSDLYGGISEGLCEGAYNHPREYWKGTPHRIEQEAVAHFFQLQFDPERLQISKEFFPKSLERFKKLMIDISILRK